MIGKRKKTNWGFKSPDIIFKKKRSLKCISIIEIINDILLYLK